jgi:hypothetical protein
LRHYLKRRRRIETPVVATRLIALLPRTDSSNIASRETFLGISAVSDRRGFIYAMAIFIGLVLGANAL